MSLDDFFDPILTMTLFLLFNAKDLVTSGVSRILFTIDGTLTRQKDMVPTEQGESKPKMANRKEKPASIQ
jgi:hypothetical protein